MSSLLNLSFIDIDLNYCFFKTKTENRVNKYIIGEESPLAKFDLTVISKKIHNIDKT